jgi:ATP-dependent DNA ligase
MTEELPRFLAPMLCATGLPDATGGWLLQVKFGGIRGQLRSEPRRWALRSRPGSDRTDCFPDLAAVHAALGRHRVLLDGEEDRHDLAERQGVGVVVANTRKLRPITDAKAKSTASTHGRWRGCWSRGCLM